jgi:small-conductance mechanosensitive channel
MSINQIPPGLVPISSTQTVTTLSGFTKYITWFKAHERLVLLLAALVFGSYMISKGYDYLIKHDQVQAQIANTQAQAAAKKVDDDTTRNQQLAQQLAQLQNSFNQLSVQFAQSMQQRATSTAAQKHIDDTSQPSELATRIQKLLGVGTIKIDTTSVVPAGGLIFSADAAHADADALEDLQQAKGDLIDTKNQLLACTQLSIKQTDVITGLQNTVGDSKLALIAEQHAHTADVKLLKVENRRSYFRGLKHGIIIGAGAATAAFIAIFK